MSVCLLASYQKKTQPGIAASENDPVGTQLPQSQIDKEICRLSGQSEYPHIVCKICRVGARSADCLDSQITRKTNTSRS